MFQPEPNADHRTFIERVLIVVAVGGLALLLWALRSLVILIFGAVLFAVILRILTNLLKRRLHFPEGLALLTAILFVFGLFAIASALFGAEVVRQAQVLRESLPQAWSVLQERLQAIGLGGSIEEWVEALRARPGGGVLSSLSNILVSVSQAITDTVLVIVGGIFFAIDPTLYRRGVLKLVPETARGRVGQALDDCWTALRLWLLARLATMAIVGVLTGLGLWLLGIQASLTLGLLAGFLDFVPFVGPIIAAVPAVLLALASDPASALWVAALYLLVQQIEGYVITPLFQKRAVELPPALLLFSLVACGLVFGIVGVLFAEPLTVVLFVLVKRLYVRDALHTPTPMPGEKQADEA